jgi:hypothetical protein
MLKLSKLPDRTPVKIAFRASPELAQMLNDYCAIYRETYERPAETIEELIPFMLAAFMESDPQFKKARKGRSRNGDVGESEISGHHRAKRTRKTPLTTAPPSSDRNQST